MIKLSQSGLGVLFVSITSLSWALLPFLLSVLLDHSDVATVVWWRFFFAAFLLLLLISAVNKKQLRGAFSFKPLVLAAALMLAANYFCFFKGIEMTTPSNAQVLIQSAPLLFTIAGIFFFKETLAHSQILGIFVATLGFGLFYRDQILNLLGDLGQYNRGNLFMVGASLSWAFYAIFNKIALNKQSAQQINLVLYAVAALVLLPTISFESLMSLSSTGWVLMCLAGANTVLAYGCLGEAIKRISAAKVSIIITLNPLITMVLSQILNYFQVSWVPEERIGWTGYLGAIFVVVGAIFVVSKRKQKT